MDSTESPWLSIVMPTLNEAPGVGDLLAALQPLLHRHGARDCPPAEQVGKALAAISADTVAK